MEFLRCCPNPPMNRPALAHWNCGWGHKKVLPILQDMCGNWKMEVLCLNEGNFKSDFRLPGYVCYRETRETSLATLFVRNDVEQAQLQLPEIEGAHLTGVKIKLGCKVVNVITIYISPNKEANITALSLTLQDLSPLLVTGEFNAKHPLWGSNTTDRRGIAICNEFEQLELTILNDGSPTFMRNYQTGLVESHLDVVATSEELSSNMYLEIEAAATFSDHCRCLLFLKDRSRPKWRTAQVVDWMLFRHLSASLLEHGNDVATSVNLALSKATKKVRLPPTVASPDMKLASLLEEAKALKNSFTKYGLLADFADLAMKKEEIMEYSQVLKDHRQEKFTSTLSSDTPLSTVWRWVKGVTESSLPKSPLASLCLATGREMADVLNELTDRVVMTEDEETQSTKVEKHAVDLEDVKRLCTPFNSWELELALCAADGQSAPGPDGITNQMLKSLGHTGKLHLLLELNRVFQSGEFPEVWKEGIGTAILKPGKARNEVGSFRIIVKTSNLGKVLERMMLRRLANLLDRKKVLNDRMSAYRRLRGAQENILDITTDIEQAVTQNGHILATFFDIEGAYDNLCHSAVLSSLGSIGVSQNCRFTRTLKSFL